MNSVIKIVILCILLIPLYGNKIDRMNLIDTNITNCNKINTNLYLKDEYKLNNIGLYKENGKIIIDVNKTEEFLKYIIIKLKENVIKLKNKTEDLNISSLGIKKERIKVDLNKTKTFLNKFSKIIKQIAKEFNSSN